ncbi:phosphoribosyltransferase family protein [Haloarcula sp. CBA1127]|uniref:phosphoribosyltransferase family protein n=1 Tax=Haloarcula sp. CBA1127 TaxID=1765055 RepID=UPI00073E1A9B|nr:phosphoribosyltransferase family protein [Haloarcula sp. CBA1127]
MNYRSFGHLSSDTREWVVDLPSDLDLIVGVPRSGMLVSNLLSLYLNVPMTDVEGLKEGRLLPARDDNVREFNVANFSKILVVDDTVASGGTMTEIQETVESLDISAETYYGAVYVDLGSEHFVDTYAEVLTTPRVFEWNMMHHGYLAESCVDLSILCEPSASLDNDDEPNYQAVLRTAEPKSVPSVKIGWIVTSQPEQYREETETWLDAHGIEYGDLIMMGHPDRNSHIAAGNRGEYKASVYHSSDARLFIADSYVQALTIARKTSKPVYSKERNVMLRQGYLSRVARGARTSIATAQSDPLYYANRFRSNPVEFSKRVLSNFL